MAILVPKREKSKLVAFNYFEIVDSALTLKKKLIKKPPILWEDAR